ncbi:ANTH-domain-containing protein [Phellopilus nigrolimitatus]|nr:ANTH-domain-containing protein [Phellopilus nigrolimitatus]
MIRLQYLDPIIAATYSEDGAIHDVCKALSPRLREPNSIVVFKALIVLHTMIRNGATDNVLSYLSSDDVLKLRGVSTGHWEGYNTPKNLQNYSIYLDTRIRTYRDLKHDPVRVQTDSNRDIRVENSVEAIRTNSFKSAGGPQRSKTMMGRKLRSMTVEKGLLRETKAVQKTTTALVECTFYLDNLEDELNVTALRMLVKDLLILFQALNEGVINVLEHYFEMSHVDAQAALSIYRSFCKQTEKVVEYLGIARKLQNLLNVPIPDLKHAPVSLVAALEEYLNDPNFEQNRIEYKTTKALADKNAKEGIKKPTKSIDRESSSSNTRATSPKPGPSSSVATHPAKESNQALVDFFSSIEEEQTVMFATQSNNQLQQQQQAPHNPFVQRQSMAMTGAFPQQQPFGQFQVPQSTGFIQPQQTAFPGAPFQQPQPNTFGQQQHPSFSSFLQPQVAQPTGFLQPQSTGANPFRQSMLMPQTTGMPAFGIGGSPGANSGTFQAPGPSFSIPPPSNQAQGFQGSSFAPVPISNTASSPPSATNGTINQSLPQRPASTPLTSIGDSFGQAMKPVVSHQTGSRNPFGVPQEPAPPVPKPPTLQELTTGAFGRPGMFGQPPAQPLPNQQQATPASTSSPFSSVTQIPSSGSTEGSGMSSIATSFSFNNNWSVDPKHGSDTTGTPSVASHPTSTSTFSSQPTGASSATSAPSFSSPLQPQTTGYSGLKAFKPTSSFGASLLESLPPIPQSGASTPSAGAQPSTQPTGNGLGTSEFGSLMNSSQSTSPPPNGNYFGGRSSTLGSNSTTTPSFGGVSSATTVPSRLGALNAQPTGLGSFPLPGGSGSAFGSSLGVGLRPQATGAAGVANPFRASMFSTSTGPTLPASGAPAFGANRFQNHSDASKQQNGVASLI